MCPYPQPIIEFSLSPPDPGAQPHFWDELAIRKYGIIPLLRVTHNVVMVTFSGVSHQLHTFQEIKLVHQFWFHYQELLERDPRDEYKSM